MDGGLSLPFYGIYAHERSYWVGDFDAYKLIEHVASKNFKESKALLPGKKEAFKQMANKLDNDDNPVLAIFTLKK